MNQNQISDYNRRYAIIPVIKFIKWTFLFYNTIISFQFLDFLVQNPGNGLDVLIRFTYASGWGYLIFMGPFIFIVVTIEYFFKQTNLGNIPQGTTIYESIVRPTVMIGAIKLISPKIEEAKNKID